MVLAFSLQSDVKSIGAYAGFAAIIGLALLVLLYFAQAREIRRLADWLAEQEERLRNAPARALAPRPAPTPPARAVPVPLTASSPEAAAAPSAIVAIPGVRRVSVGAGGALSPPGPGAPAAGVDPAAATTAGEAGAVAAATVAGAMTAAAAAGTMAAAAAAAEAPGSDAAEAEAAARPLPPAPARRRGRGAPSAAVQGTGEIPNPAAGDGPGAAAGEGAPQVEPGGDASPSAAVPLIARPAATAEPVGDAQEFGGAADTHGGSADLGPDTAETAAVAPLDSGTVATLDREAGVARAAPPEVVPPFGPQAAVGAPFTSGEAVEISAERIASPLLDGASPVEEPPVAGEDAGAGETGEQTGGPEPGALAPSTAAGARPRFPPGPPAPTAAAVGAPGPTVAAVGPPAPSAAAVGATAPAGVAAAVDTALAAEDAATTRRRQLPPSEDAHDADARPRGSALRLLVAGAVIVLVLIFIATKVFGSGTAAKPTGLSPSKITVAVLNGTHVPGLAGSAASELTRSGFKQGVVANALSHGHHVTLVSYTPGNLAAAKVVAKALDPNHTRVGPADARTAALVAAAAGAPAKVIITLGSEFVGR
jgi:hypothetical protein